MGDSRPPATMMKPLSFQQYQLVYNFTSFGLAAMGASTIFFFSRMQSFNEKYKPALSFTGLVTLIAMYHYFRIFNSFEAAFTPCKVTAGKVDYSLCNAEVFGYTATADRDRSRDEARRGRDSLEVHPAWHQLCADDRLRLPWRVLWRRCHPLALLVYLHVPVPLHRLPTLHWAQERPGRRGGRHCQEPGPVGLLGHCDLLVHLPHRLHPSDAHGQLHR